MKTAREWSKEYWGAAWTVSDERAITARDAEHRAELANLAADNDAMSRRFMTKCAGFDAQLVELERLKGELAECEAALQLGREGIQAYCDSENAMRDELAEAKNIAKECRDMMIMQMKRESGEFHLSAEAFAPMWGAAITAATKFLAAPPPAESRCTASAGSCNSPKSCGKAGSCIDARMREVAPPAESTPVQATPEGALRNVMAGRLPWQSATPNIRERLVDFERRLAALEAKGEPGAHACDCQEEYCQLRSGLPLTAAHPVHCKGAKP